MEILLSLGGLTVAIMGFIAGRVFSESEKILSEKRRIYEEFLRVCPEPTVAYDDDAEVQFLTDELLRIKSVLMLYASSEVLLALQAYTEEYGRAASILNSGSPALHPACKKLAQSHNRLIKEMRVDGLAWSVFARQRVRQKIERPPSVGGPEVR